MDRILSTLGRTASFAALFTMTVAVVVTAQTPIKPSSAHWAQWRGPATTGVAPGDAPTRWDDTTNVKWATPVPGRGFSSPIVWGDRVFVTTAVPTRAQGAPSGRSRGSFAGGGAGADIAHRFDVLALDRVTGRILWQRTATVATPHEGYHRQYGSFASNTPVTDGRHVWVSFGSRGLYAYDMDGTLVWKRAAGVQMRMHMQFGEGAPFLLHGDRLFHTFDHQGDSFMVALDKHTGKEVWRADRAEISNWSMPVVVEHQGTRQVVVSATRKTRAYDYDSGRLVWEVAGLGQNTIPSPVQFGDLVFVMSGFRNPNLMAVRLGRTGDLTGTDAIVWSTTRGTSYTPSPVLHDGMLYVLTDSGMLSNFDAKTGKPHYRQVRLPKPYNFKASPVAAGGKLYLSTEEGDVVVVKLGAAFEVLAINALTDQSFVASPAVAAGDMFLRSRTTLYRISES